MEHIYVVEGAIPYTRVRIERAADLYQHPFFRTEWEVSSITDTLHERSERVLWAIEWREREGV